MTLSQSGRGSYRWLTITLVVAAGMYAWYAVGQYARLNDLNQRQLSNAGAEIEGGARHRRRNGAPVQQGRWQETSRSTRSGAAPVCDFDKNQPYLDLLGSRRVRAEDARAGVLGRLLGRHGGDDIRRSRSSAQRGQGRRTVDEIQVRTDTVLQELAFPDSFGLIFVATEDGEGPVSGIADAAPVAPPSAMGRADVPRRARRSPAGLISGTSPRSLGGTADDVEPAAIGEQPVQCPARGHGAPALPPAAGAGERQRTDPDRGGRVPTRTIVRDALALDTYLVGVLVFLLLLGVLGFPFVKLAASMLTSAFGLRDIRLLYLSTGALLALSRAGRWRWTGT